MLPPERHLVDFPCSVYRLDHELADLAGEMQAVGFLFDRERAGMLSAILRGYELGAIVRANEALGRRLRLGRSGGVSLNDLRTAFFRDLRAPVYYVTTKTGAPALGAASLQAYALCANPRLRELALAVMDLRRARKIRSTYIDRVSVDPADGRVHACWYTYGTVAGRWTSSDPNLANLPRPEHDPTTPWGGVRSLYVPESGWELIYFDASQIEMRVAAYTSADDTMIEACESGDLHSANAALIFGSKFTDEADPAVRKALRSLAKQAGFAVVYMSSAPTVHAQLVRMGQPVTLRQVEAVLSKVHSVFWCYYRWQDQELVKIAKRGYVETPICGRRRWLGHEPLPTEAANYPIQGGAADFMNLRAVRLRRELRRHSLRARMVAYAYDSLTLECPSSEVDETIHTVEWVFSRPIVFGSSGLAARLPIEVERLDRWH
jgi:DNA polymerase-1